MAGRKGPKSKRTPSAGKLPPGFPMHKHPELKAKIKADFLIVLRNTGNVSRAALEVGVARSTMERYKNEDEEFAAAWKEADEAALDEIEEVVRNRAVHGTERPVFYQGEICGHVTEYSDSNAQFLLERKRYPKKQVELTGANGEPLQGAPPPQLVVNFVSPKKNASTPNKESE